MDAFPAVTIIAHVETKKEMDMFGPGSLSREEKGKARLQQMQDTGKINGRALTADEKTQVKTALARRQAVIDELKNIVFQSATLTFDHDFSVDLGNREVQIKFMGRGNTGGDAVVYLPKEKIAVVGDLVGNPFSYIYDGYPSEWIQTLQNIAQLNASAIVPGHGEIMHDNTHILLFRDFMKSAIDQMDVKLRQTGPAMFLTVDDIKPAVDLSSFRERFTGGDKDLDPFFDEMANSLIKVMLGEASLH